MEAMLGISLYSYLYLKQQNRYVILIISYFLFYKIRKQEGGTGSFQKHGGGGVGRSGEVAQTMYTHVSKCKNDKRKKNE
jgi:hypothetical protein